jgi:hypothetical protein
MAAGVRWLSVDWDPTMQAGQRQPVFEWVLADRGSVQKQLKNLVLGATVPPGVSSRPKKFMAVLALTKSLR